MQPRKRVYSTYRLVLAGCCEAGAHVVPDNILHKLWMEPVEAADGTPLLNIPDLDAHVSADTTEDIARRWVEAKECDFATVVAKVNQRLADGLSQAILRNTPDL